MNNQVVQSISRLGFGFCSTRLLEKLMLFSMLFVCFTFLLCCYYNLLLLYYHCIIVFAVAMDVGLHV